MELLINSEEHQCLLRVILLNEVDEILKLIISDSSTLQNDQLLKWILRLLLQKD